MVPGNFFGYFLVCYKKVTRKNIDTLCTEFYSGFVRCKLSLSWGQNHLRRRSFCPHTPTPWLLSCLGEDSANEKMFLFEVSL